MPDTFTDLQNHGSIVGNNGTGGIWLSNADGSNFRFFAYAGWDASFCWGGDWLIWTDYYGQRILVSRLDGSEIYDIGVVARSGGWLSRPTLAVWNNNLYMFHSLNANGGLDYNVCGASGYGLFGIVQNGQGTGGDLSPDGGWIIGVGPSAQGNTSLSLFRCQVDGSNFFWNAFLKDRQHDDMYDYIYPTINPADNNHVAFTIANWGPGVNLFDPSTMYKFDIGIIYTQGVNANNQQVAAFMNINPFVYVDGQYEYNGVQGYSCLNPNWSPLGYEMIFDFTQPTGTGNYMAGIKGRAGPWDGSSAERVINVCGNGALQHNSAGVRRVRYQ